MLIQLLLLLGEFLGNWLGDAGIYFLAATSGIADVDAITLSLTRMSNNSLAMGTAVYATMYVRDHARPHFHAALGIDPDDYDYQVFRITSEVSRQVFPVVLDIDHPAFKAGLDRLVRISRSMEKAAARGGIAGKLRKGALSVAAAATFARLYLVPVKRNEVPASVRLEPAW